MMVLLGLFREFWTHITYHFSFRGCEVSQITSMGACVVLHTAPRAPVASWTVSSLPGSDEASVTLTQAVCTVLGLVRFQMFSFLSLWLLFREEALCLLHRLLTALLHVGEEWACTGWGRSLYCPIFTRISSLSACTAGAQHVVVFLVVFHTQATDRVLPDYQRSQSGALQQWCASRIFF